MATINNAKQFGFISIHAPREGSDMIRLMMLEIAARFLSTLPVRGATIHDTERFPKRTISIHAPREGSDRDYSNTTTINEGISIHAPREGSDAVALPAELRRHISIHAPREGSDGGYRI